MTELKIPYPPSANKLWTRSKYGMRRTDEYTAWLWEASGVARGQNPEAVAGKYKLTIEAVRPDKRRRDLDNLLKATGDLLQCVGVIDDDCNCNELTARWVESGPPFLVRVEAA